jgi:hypothetical protein
VDKRGLCLRLVKAESEEDIIHILKEFGFWDNEDVWRDYGDDPGNIRLFTNQQDDPAAAIVEKLINSIDAVLMRECQTRGVSPESRDAPQSMKLATEKFFDVKGGSLNKLAASRRKELADNIHLVATGTSDNPCYLIIDKGEGQIPRNFPDTLVSLRRQNKVRIHFVQGVYNMGSTGVARFCGDHHLQLIVSKRHPDLAKSETDDESRDCWGFTIVRKFPPSPGARSSVYRYLAPEPDCQVLSFKSKFLPVLPRAYPDAYGQNLEWGTIIKLYDYHVRGRLRTNILMWMLWKLELHLAEPPLPIMVYERRPGYGGSGHEKILKGLTVRLFDNPRETLEDGFPSTGTINVAGNSVSYRIYAFKKGSSDSYSTNESVIFLVNGQTHDIRTRDFLRKKSVEMSYLADSILAVVDCTELPRTTTEFLFMASRDRSSKDEIMEEIEKQLEEKIRTHKGLRNLKEKRRREEAKAKLEDPKPVEEVLKKAIERMPQVARLFEPNGRSGNPFRDRLVAEEEEWIGKPFPTYFRLTSEKKRIVHTNRIMMHYETDVENLFFDRDEYKGRYSLRLNDDRNNENSKYIHNMDLWNGRATLSIEFLDNIKEGDQFCFTSKVWEDSREDMPFVESFKILIGKTQESGAGGPSSRTKPPSSSDGKKRKREGGFIPPVVTKVYEEEYDKYGFDKFTALVVKHIQDNQYDYYVNMDNLYLKREMKTRSILSPDILRAQFMYALLIIGAALLREDSEAFDDYEKDSSREDEVRRITRGLAPTLISMLYDIRNVIDDVA